MITNEQVQFALNIGSLNSEDERIFYKMVSGVLTEEEIRDMKIVVAYFRMKANPHRENAMKSEMAETLYKYFTTQKAEA